MLTPATDTDQRECSLRSLVRVSWCCVCALISAVSGCAAGQAATPAPSAPAVVEGVARYMPLQEGYVYQYDVETDMGETGRMMIAVSLPRAGLAELNIAGKVQRLEITADAVRHATGGYLLKAPLQVGSQWKGQFGLVRLTRTDRSIQTPAGAFQNCIETVEDSSAPAAKRATSVFCPDVGMVQLTIEGALDGEAASVSTTLRSFGPRATGNE